ncbi:MAG TPA: hypothetical protein VM032_05705 [Vicinamibacterales bacterium]|nr:hypothetical protein [Vicinamibacterales bacterium]
MPARIPIAILFFVSGFTALLYQTVWQRLLVLFLGADIYATTIIVGAFMAGLGFGSIAGGAWSDRLTSTGRIRAFAACELAIALFAVNSTWLYYDRLYGSAGARAISPVAGALIVFLVTLIPTFAMGMSLPLIANAAGDDDAVSRSRRISRLYGWNTLGAAAGSLTAVLYFFRAFDIRSILTISACGSTAIGLLGLLMSFSQSTVRPLARASGRTEAAPPQPGAYWFILYGLSGVVALSLEIVWFRTLGVVLKSNAITFGYLLAIYLAGLGIGALAANAPALRKAEPLKLAVLLQAVGPTVAVALFAVVTQASGRVAAGRVLWEYLGRGERSLDATTIALVYVVVPLVTILPATIAMGLAFGAVQRAVQQDAAFVGRRIGALQAVNVIGATLGAIATGLGFLGWLGSPGTLAVLLVLSVAPLCTWLVRHKDRSRAWVLPAVAAVVLILLPGQERFWAALHGNIRHQVVVGEDGSGLIVLRRDPGETKVFLGGLNQSWLPYKGVHTALGAIPSLLHPSPRLVAVIGLGSGDTAYSIGGRSDTASIDCIEIMAPQAPALRALLAVAPYPALDLLLRDRRVHHAVADARRVLRQSGARYDLIEADALFPTASYAGNLYSREYFELLRDRLAAGGFAATWLPTERTRRTLLAVFPFVVTIGNIGIGSMTPLPADLQVIKARLADPFTRDHFERGQVDIEAVLDQFTAARTIWYGPDSPRSDQDLNHDLFPRDEFAVPPANRPD